MTEEPAARLYLLVPPRIDAATLGAALDGGDVGCVLLTAADTDSGALVRTAQDREVAALVPDDPKLVQRLGADGVHLGPGHTVKAARAALPDDRIVGAACATSRHEAMLAGEAGADYVAFAGRAGDPEASADPEILRWWQTMMTLPCVAMGAIGLGDTGDMARAGADFVALGEAVWDHPDGPGAAVAEANRQLAEAG